MPILNLFFLLTAYSETVVITKVPERDYSMETPDRSLLWNSVNVGLEWHIRCSWIENYNKRRTLARCHSGIPRESWILVKPKPITTRPGSCSVFMGRDIIGRHYNHGHCKEGRLRRGFEIFDHVHVVIDEENYEITISLDNP